MKRKLLIMMTSILLVINTLLCSCSKEEAAETEPIDNSATVSGETTNISTLKTEAETTDPQIIENENKYNAAVEIINNGDSDKYEEAYETLKSLSGYKDSDTYLEGFVWLSFERELTDNSDETRIYETKYDKDGNVVEESTFVSYSRDVQERVTWNFTYNDGYVVENDETGYNIHNIYYYTYDDNGMLIKEEIDDQWDGGGYMIYYTYDNDGHLIKEEHNGHGLETDIIIEYTYDEDGKLYTEKTVKGDDILDGFESETTSSHIIYTYNDNNQLIESTETYNGLSVSGAYTRITTSTYKYNDTGKLIEIYSENDGGYSTTAYTYDEFGNLIKENYEYTVIPAGHTFGYSIKYKDYKLCYFPAEQSK